MEPGTIEREIYIDAPRAVVFDVVSDPDHVTVWWPDEARYEAVAGSVGEILFGDADQGGKLVALTVVDVNPPTRFSFRWTHGVGERGAVGNSLLVTFELTPKGDGTLLKFSEVGFHEMGWAAAVMEEQVKDHTSGWDHFLPRLASYAEGVGVS